MTTWMINITLEEYETLIESCEFLLCLKAAGVDNWEGYNNAVEMYEADGFE